MGWLWASYATSWHVYNIEVMPHEHLKSSETWLFVQELVQANIKNKKWSSESLCFCEGNQLMTVWFPSQRASNAEIIAIFRLTTKRILKCCITGSLWESANEKWSPLTKGQLCKSVSMLWCNNFPWHFIQHVHWARQLCIQFVVLFLVALNSSPFFPYLSRVFYTICFIIPYLLLFFFYSDYSCV